MLLVNDLVLKALWPHPWTTGKLSDLAWMVFSPPLLAYLLSFAARGNLRAQQAAFGVAYVGLPLLYAAFNTFAPLHGWIMRGFSLVTDGAGGSPLDAYDSVVIPFALGIAVWVWRRGPVAPGGLLSRLGMVTAALAAFATVATSETASDEGIRMVAVSPQGIVGGLYWGFMPYKSHNGGLNWVTRENPYVTGGETGGEENIRWGGEFVETPRGTYKIEGADILLLVSGEEPRQVFSAAYLQESGNRWFQEIEGRQFGERGISSGPTSVIFDPRSGNVVAALGTQGVVVGTSDGRWIPAAVDSYAPTDFSLSRKFGALLSEVDFWASVLIFPLSMIAAAFVVVALFPLRELGFFTLLSMATGIVITMLISFHLLTWVGSTDEFEDNLALTGSSEPVVILLSIVSIVAALFVLRVSLSDQPKPHWRAVIGGYIGMMVFIVLCDLAWLQFGWSFGVARFLAIVLCIAITITLALYLIRYRATLEQQANQPQES